MNEYEWHARVCLGSLYSSVAWLIDRKKKSHWRVVALAGSEVVLCPPWSPLVRQCAPNSEHTMRVLDRPCWGSCWTEVTSDQLEQIRAKSWVFGKNVLGSKFGLCCLKKFFPYKICDMIPVRYPEKGRMVIKWSLLVYYEVLQHVHHVISCHLFKLSSFTTVYLTIFRKVLCWLGHLASLHCFLSCAWLKLQLATSCRTEFEWEIAIIAFVDLELLLSAMLHTSLSICRFRFSISTILFHNEQVAWCDTLRPLSLQCNARYDHIRFAAEALKLRDKVRVSDVLGPQDEWICKSGEAFPFTFHVGGFPNIWLISDSYSFMSCILRSLSWIHGYGLSTQWLSWWMLVLYVCFVPGMTSISSFTLHVLLVVQGEPNLYTYSSMICLLLAKVSIT